MLSFAAPTRRAPTPPKELPTPPPTTLSPAFLRQITYNGKATSGPATSNSSIPGAAAALFNAPDSDAPDAPPPHAVDEPPPDPAMSAPLPHFDPLSMSLAAYIFFGTPRHVMV